MGTSSPQLQGAEFYQPHKLEREHWALEENKQPGQHLESNLMMPRADKSARPSTDFWPKETMR